MRGTTVCASSPPDNHDCLRASPLRILYYRVQHAIFSRSTAAMVHLGAALAASRRRERLRAGLIKGCSSSMSAICRKSWPSMSLLQPLAPTSFDWTACALRAGAILRRIDAPKLEGSSQYPCSEVSIMFMSGPHYRPIQFLRPTGGSEKAVLLKRWPSALGGNRTTIGSPQEGPRSVRLTQL